MEKSKIIFKPFCGFGNRIRSLLSIKLISEHFDKDFKIWWKDKDLAEYFDYDKYYWGKKITKSDTIVEIRKKHRNVIKRKFAEENGEYKYPNINIYVCTAYIISDPFCPRKLLNQEYTKLYSEILIPRKTFLNDVSKILQDKKNIVGIQWRTNDNFMLSQGGAHHPGLNIPTSEEKEVLLTYMNSKLKEIKKICDNKFDNYFLFLTSDTTFLFEESTKIFDSSQIIYNDDDIHHIDLYHSKENENIQCNSKKTYLDHYILAQKTDMLFITYGSSYGETAALTNTKREIYDIRKLKRLFTEDN